MLSLCSDSKQFGVGKVPWGKHSKICLMLSTFNYLNSNVGWTIKKKKNYYAGMYMLKYLHAVFPNSSLAAEW